MARTHHLYESLHISARIHNEGVALVGDEVRSLSQTLQVEDANLQTVFFFQFFSESNLRKFKMDVA